jgi:hypothetical protein
MSNLMLNSLPASVFTAKAGEYGGSQKRAAIISAGRLLMNESAATPLNALRTSELRSDRLEKVISRFPSTADYKDTNEKTQRELMLYCAEICDKMVDREPPADMDEFRRNQRRYLNDSTFLKVLAGVTQEIIAPILPTVFSEAVDLTATVQTVPVGETLEIDVGSNDVFLFQDSSWGASRSVPSNYLYAKTVTLNPKPRTAKATVKWYQLVGNGADIGQFFNAMAKGMYSKTMGMWNNAMISMAANTDIVPSALSYTYSTSNFITLANKLAAVNGVGIRNLIAFGNAVACSKILPTGITNASSVSLDSAISMLLGAEYIRAGYIGENMGVRVLPMNDAIVPGTQNTTVQTVLSNTTAYMMAGPGMGYKPLVIGMETGSPVQVEILPTESGDMTWNVNLTMTIDVVPVVASKIGKLTVS